jgi:hypothetical protein
MQKIEGVVNEAHAALAIARGLGLRKARQAIVANPAQLAVEVGCLHPDLCQRSPQRPAMEALHRLTAKGLHTIVNETIEKAASGLACGRGQAKIRARALYWAA